MNYKDSIFELCKEVYKRFPEWGDTDVVVSNDGEQFIFEDARYWLKHGSGMSPLYTSDYLLEKLLKVTTIELIGLPNGEVTLLYRPNKPDYTDYTSDTPLKALLKLVLALHEAGELK